jgi:hypothetical protein
MSNSIRFRQKHQSRARMSPPLLRLPASLGLARMVSSDSVYTAKQSTGCVVLVPVTILHFPGNCSFNKLYRSQHYPAIISPGAKKLQRSHEQPAVVSRVGKADACPPPSSMKLKSCMDKSESTQKWINMHMMMDLSTSHSHKVPSAMTTDIAPSESKNGADSGIKARGTYARLIRLRSAINSSRQTRRKLQLAQGRGQRQLVSAVAQKSRRRDIHRSGVSESISQFLRNRVTK